MFFTGLVLRTLAVLTAFVFLASMVCLLTPHCAPGAPVEAPPELRLAASDSRPAAPPPEPMRMLATAYTHATPGGCVNGTGDGLTAMGIKVQEGIAAVDPNVIPLGTRLHIQGYGEALAADTGGAIRGNRVDVFFDSPSRALNWGVRRVEVRVLDDGRDGQEGFSCADGESENH